MGATPRPKGLVRARGRARFHTRCPRRGRSLPESNPLRGLKTPKEKNPTRVLLTEPEYEDLLEVSLSMDWRFRVALVIAHETGHRIGAIRQLRWSDIDLEARVIRLASRA